MARRDQGRALSPSILLTARGSGGEECFLLSAFPPQRFLDLRPSPRHL